MVGEQLTSTPPGRRLPAEAAWVTALLLLGLAVRVAFVLVQQPGFYFEDSLDYDRAARSLLETGHFHPRYYRFPFYPVFLAGSYRLFGDGLMPVRLMQAVIGAATCSFIWLAGRRLFGARAALLALALAAIFPVHVVMSGVEYPVVLGMFFIAMVLWLHACRSEGGVWPWGRLALAAAATACASALFEAGLVLGAFLFAGLLLQRSPGWLRLKQLGMLAALGGIALLPWFARIAPGRNFRPILLKAAIHLPSAPGVDAPVMAGNGSELLQIKLEGLIKNPGWTLRHIWREFLHFWNPYPDRLASAEASFRERLHKKDSRMVLDNSLVGDLPRRLYAIGFSLLLTAAAVGAILAWRGVPGARFLVGWPIFLALCYAPFFTQMRYRIPADPAFILLGAYTLERTLGRFGNRPGDSLKP